MTYSSNIHHLYPLQDQILARIYACQKELGIEKVILCGGTALARCYLHHRISYDLDFFVPHRFSVDRLLQKAGKYGLQFQDTLIEDGDEFVTQIHTYVSVDKEIIKVSFVEDVYEGMWKGNLCDGIYTEEISGLYYRKLRTVTGSGYGDKTLGARQNARDLFDLYVLHTKIESMSKFIRRINKSGANLPVAPFCANLITMPWLELMDEFDRLVIADEYCDINFYRQIRNTLVGEALTIQNQGL